MLDVPPTPPATLTRARRIAIDQGLRYVYVGNVHDEGGSSTYCHKCGEKLIGRDWYSPMELTPRGAESARSPRFRDGGTWGREAVGEHGHSRRRALRSPKIRGLIALMHGLRVRSRFPWIAGSDRATSQRRIVFAWLTAPEHCPAVHGDDRRWCRGPRQRDQRPKADLPIIILEWCYPGRLKLARRFVGVAVLMSVPGGIKGADFAATSVALIGSRGSRSIGAAPDEVHTWPSAGRLSRPQ
jgi:hypothetical protein